MNDDGSWATGPCWSGRVSPRSFVHAPIVMWAVLLALAALAWALTVFEARSLGDMGAGMRDMPPAPPPTLAFLTTWIVMMVAMMFPSVAPTVAAFTAVSRYRRETGRRAAPAWMFLLGYLAVWGLFGAGAYLLSLVVPDVGMTSPGLRASSPLGGGLILILAGLYQWSPVKRSCLEHFRSPLASLQHEWREGAPGAFRSGVACSTYCVGCSGGLMLVLFAVGLMNLGWMVLLAAVIFAEKVVPQGPLIGKLAGMALLISGVAMSAAWWGRFRV